MLDPRVDTFLTVCRTMNFTHAAQLLHLTQPAVSQHIHTLEEEFGAKFFRYENRQFVLHRKRQAVPPGRPPPCATTPLLLEGGHP